MVNITFLFFQTKYGIRDIGVTGVQTCALPILHFLLEAYRHCKPICVIGEAVELLKPLGMEAEAPSAEGVLIAKGDPAGRRSEERCVGKECRSWWSPNHYK